MLLNYINGEYVIAASEDMQTVINPANEEVVARNVTENLFERHIKPVFLGA